MVGVTASPLMIVAPPDCTVSMLRGRAELPTSIVARRCRSPESARTDDAAAAAASATCSSKSASDPTVCLRAMRRGTIGTMLSAGGRGMRRGTIGTSGVMGR